MKTPILLFFVLLASQVLSQSRKTNTDSLFRIVEIEKSKADILRKKNIDSALVLYKSTAKKYAIFQNAVNPNESFKPFLGSIYNEIAIIYRIKKQKDSSFSYLKSAFINHNDYISLLHYDVANYFSRDTINILRQISDSVFFAKGNLNYQVAFTIRYMFYQDQYSRIKNGYDANTNRIDSINTKMLNEIIDNYGWQHKFNVNNEIFMLIYHSPDINFKIKMLKVISQMPSDGNKLDEFVKEDNIQMLLDLILVLTNRPTLYGKRPSVKDGRGGLHKNPSLEERNKVRAEFGISNERE